MKLEIINYMGDDLTVVNAARVSLNKESAWDIADDHTPVLKEKDKKLIQYLSKHNHWTPFSQVQIQCRFKMPIFLARQHFKSQVGVSRNEVSRRYVQDKPEFYLPDTFRAAPTDGVKQGSSGEVDEMTNTVYRSETEDFYAIATSLYERMLDSGIAPEEARMVLPQAMYTEFIETGSLAYYARLYGLRADRHAQSQWWGLMSGLDREMTNLFPVSWAALLRREV